MNRGEWITIGGVVIGIGIAAYIGMHNSPSVKTTSIAVPNTASIDTNAQTVQALLNELTTQQQMANSLGLGTAVSTPLSSSTS